MPGIVQGQSNPIYQLYIENRFADIETMYQSGKIQNAQWQEFVKILFETDVEVALSNFINLYQRSDDKTLNKLILDRISQYYYAKGLYDSADKILNDAKFRKRIFSITKETIFFGVQLGAFSSYENATNGKKQYERNVQEIYIIEKESAGKKLSVIVAGKFTSRSEAEKYKDNLKKRFGINGMIIQY